MKTINLNEEQAELVKDLLNKTPEGKHVISILGL